MSNAWGAIERLTRRLQMVIGFGRVSASREGSTGALQINFGAGEVHDSAWNPGQYGVVSRPLPGADAVVAFLGGNRSAAVVIATGDRRYRLALEEGEVALYTDQGDKVHLGRHELLIEAGAATQNVRIKAPTQVVVECPLVKLGGDGATKFVKLADGSNSTTTKAL